MKTPPDSNMATSDPHAPREDSWIWEVPNFSEDLLHQRDTPAPLTMQQDQKKRTCESDERPDVIGQLMAWWRS
ncbi:MAG: hypothetical protein GYB25_02000 [Rhodobacteraceae bacterium]|nr:hypothetical protein [Paracoccaceae bacterium]